MTENEMQLHVYKEVLKKIINEGPNYTEKMKFDLKQIIDLSESNEEMCKAILIYFSLCQL